jgi:tetratricopeptide (TPR) repeat protein
MRQLDTAEDLACRSATLDSIGYIHHRLGAFKEATEHFERSLDLTRRLGIRYGEASTLTNLAETQLALGNRDDARGNWQAALALLEDLCHADAKQVKAKLEMLDPPDRAG